LENKPLRSVDDNHLVSCLPISELETGKTGKMKNIDSHPQHQPNYAGFSSVVFVVDHAVLSKVSSSNGQSQLSEVLAHL